jgi:hypothetical protein
MRGLNTVYLQTAKRTLSSTYENLKLRLIKEYTELPNPSVYLVNSKLKVPFDQTLMPVAKRLLVKQISKAA